MADWQKVGNMLAGFGAGVQGRGNEFLYYQDRARMEAEALAEQQRQAYIQDTMADLSSVYELRQAGDMAGVREVVQSGIMKAQQMGDTDSDWFQWAEWLDSGKLTDFDSALNSDVTQFVAGGHMAAPPTMARRQELEKLHQTESVKAQYRAEPDRIAMWKFMQTLSPEQQESFAKLVPGGVTVNTGDQVPGDPYAEKRNELAIDENQGIYLRGADARNSIPRYNLALSLLDKVETGPLTERINAAKKYGQAFGFDVDPDKVANYEQLAPIFGKLTMEKIQETKGSVSNKEMEMFERMNANYQYSTEGNRRLIKFAKARAERDVEIRSLIRDMRKDGAKPVDISEAVDTYIQQNDMSKMLESLIGDSKQVGRFTVEVQ